MQKKGAILLTSLVLVAVLCAAILPCAFISAKESTANAAVDLDAYYKPITASQGTELLGQLHDLITDTHTKYTSYTDCKTPSIIQKTDAGSKSGTVMEFYSQADIAGTWGSGAQGTWNREHVWCQSLSSGLWGESGGGSDLHHLRPAESGLNSARGNNKYGTVANRESHKVYYEDNQNNPVALGGYNYSKVFEPIDEVKGDVARIVLYVYVHYNSYTSSIFGGHATTNGSRQSNSFGALPIRNIINANSDREAFDLLIAWNESDHVDDVERNRNEAVYALQGNRNPFVDHPEFINAIWGNGGGGDVTSEAPVLDKTSLVMKMGGSTETISITSNVSGTPKWSTDNSSVVSIIPNGNECTLIAAGSGNATITVTVNGQEATCSVIVVSGDPQQFTTLVRNLSNHDTMEEKFLAMKSALVVYDMLNDNQQNDVANDYAVLRQEIAAYNDKANAHNDTMSGAILASSFAQARFFEVFKFIFSLIFSKLV